MTVPGGLRFGVRAALVCAAVLLAGAGARGQQRAPSGAPPAPVLLVPGWGDSEVALGSLRTRFIEAGWPPGRVIAVEFEDPVGSNRAHAREVETQIRALREVAAGDPVDIVAHSMGGLAVRYHLANRGAEGVRRVVFLATPHRGTVAAYVAWGRGSEEMEPGSPFLDTLNARPPVPHGVRALNVHTPLDLRVIPGSSAILPETDNVRNVEVCCPTHPGILDDPETFRIVVAFLRGEGTVPDRPGAEGAAATPGSGRAWVRDGGARRP